MKQKLFVFTEKQLNEALENWFVANNPHANIKVKDCHPEVKAVEEFMLCKYMQQYTQEVRSKDDV